MNKDWELEPSFFVRSPKGFNSVTDITMRMLYLRDNWMGLTYRSDETGVFLFGFRYLNMYFSYSYDHTFAGNIQQHTYGTHELGISFQIESTSSIRHIRSW